MTLKKRTLRNLGAVAGAQIVAVSLGQISILFLAHILDTEDFGLYAIVFVVYTIVMILATGGIDQASIQSKEEENKILSTGRSLRGLITGAVILFLIAFAPLISASFERPNLTEPLRLTTIALLFSYLSFASFVRLSRKLKFAQISMARVVYAVVWPIAALAGAVAGLDYWSLVLALILAYAASSLMLIYYEHRSIPMELDKKLAKGLLRYGEYVLASGLAYYLMLNLDKIVIGIFLAEGTLGVYFLAYSWGTAVPNLFTNVANTVMFPTYTHITEDKETLRKAYARTFTYSAYLSIPIGIGLAAIAGFFVKGVLGPEWSAASVPLAILSIGGMMYSLLSPASNLFLATGHPELVWRQTMMMFVPSVLLVVPMVVYLGIDGAALLMMAVATLSLVWTTWKSSRLLEIPTSSLPKSILRPTLAALAMGIATFGLSLVLPASVGWVVVLILGGMIVYLALVIALTKGSILRDMREIIQLLRSRKDLEDVDLASP